MLIQLDLEYPNLKAVANAVRFLKKGDFLAYPTDTTYGIGVDPTCGKSVARLFEETLRSPDKPATLLCADLRMVSQYAFLSNNVFRVAKRALPGPYTLILPASNQIPRHMHGKRKEVGIRIPDHPIVQHLIATLGRPILNISARGRDGSLLREAREIESLWGYRLEAVIDCGPLDVRESTVIDLVEEPGVVLREGAGEAALFL